MNKDRNHFDVGGCLSNRINAKLSVMGMPTKLSVKFARILDSY